MSKRVYEKTDKGREEIATRKHHLSVRLRSVLVMIDGRRPVSELLQHLAKLGLDKTSFDELVTQEFIHSLPCAEDDVVDVAPVVARVPPGLRRMHKLHGGAVKLGELDLVSVDGVIDVAPQAVAPPAAPPSVFAELPAGDTERFKSVHRFYNETIRGNLGLRGFALQLKVERADTLDDLRALRAPYLEAVKKTKGNEMAQALDARLLSLLAEPAAA
ncbi:hypothetical protein [Massilia sp. S19_KUP03_FR1]|uniref:hypothetical protein n=1 Tax=Massilia sp. S19_KUP03_FR1 TaxID=3025503 RepID=UPI002FCDD4D7